MLTGTFENNPVRHIVGRAELLGGSATSVMGSSVAIDDLYPIPHEIKIEAKSENLLDLNIIDAGGYGTAKVEGNNIVVSPRADGTYYYIKPATTLYEKLNVGDTYTFSMDSVSEHSGNWGWRIKYKNGTYTGPSKTTYLTIQWTDDISWIYFYFGMPYTTENAIICSNVQVRKASEVLPFIPYVDTSEVVISATGRNLLMWRDYEVIGTNVDTYTRDGIIGRLAKTGITTSWLATGSINETFLPNPYIEPGTYTLTAEWVSVPTAYAKKKIYLGLTLEDGTTVDWYSGETRTFTQTAQITSIRCESLSLKLNEVMEARFMLERGTEAHPYAKAFIDELVGGGTIGSNGSFVQAHATLPANTYLQVDYLKQTNESFTHDGDLQSITIDRAGANKFFGFGICQKANIKIRDVERKYKADTSSLFDIYFDNKLVLPRFKTTEVHRDENTNAMSITAYDAIYQAEKHTVSELGLTSYTISEFTRRCGALLGIDVVCPSATEFTLSYENGANFGGEETIRQALDAVAEATQTVYFINSDNKLVFKRINFNADADYTIDKTQYFTLDSKTNRRLVSIASITELGDNYENYEASLNMSGTTQYIRENPFWNMREDITTLVDNALATMGGMTINQFDCSWRGNYLVEPCDKLALITKNGEAVYSYLFNDTIEYNGVYSQKTNWEYADEEEETTNPTNLGDVLKQTYAKVDKQEKRIDLVVDDTTQLSLTTNDILASVNAHTSEMSDAFNSINEELVEINNKVSMTMNAEEVEILVSEKISNGVDSIETQKGFKFNDEGLTISASDSNISTNITETGMRVNQGSKEMLSATDKGVKAVDLHATTYLIIGANSRFEDYDGRTGCFWIGG